MFGQTSQGNTSFGDTSTRMFRFEVSGLHQTSTPLNYSIRLSGSTFVAVPYNRMNEEMQRINRLGGKIVSIQPLGETAATATTATATAATADKK